MLKPGDDPARALPASGPILEAVNATHFLPGLPVMVAHPRHWDFDLIQQFAVFAEPDQVVHAVAVTPFEQPGAIEAGIAAEHDPGSRPVLADDAHQQRQDRPAVAGIAVIARAQVADQQVAAAEHVQRQVAVVIVVPVKVLDRLLTVQRNIGTIEIQNQLFWWHLMLVNELLPQYPVSLDNRLAIHATFHPAQRGLAGQGLIPADGAFVMTPGFLHTLSH